MTDFKDYYKILGTHRNSDKAEIGARFLMAMREARSKSDSHAMSLIQEAYAVLSGEQKEQYDAAWDSAKGMFQEAKGVSTQERQIAVKNSQSEELAIDMQNFIDLYHILNVPRRATLDMIQEAYQKLLDLYNEGLLKEEYGQSLVALGTKAVDILSNSELKVKYDLLWDQVNDIATTKTKTGESWRTTEPIPYRGESRGSAFSGYPRSIVAYINSDILASGNFQKPSENNMGMVSLKHLYGVIQDDYTFQFAKENGTFYVDLTTVFGRHTITDRYFPEDCPWYSSELMEASGHKMLVIPAIKFISPDMMRLGWLSDKINMEDLGKLQNHISKLMLETPEVFERAFEDAAKKSKSL